MNAPEDKQVLKALLVQVSRSIGAGDETDVGTTISRPMYDAFLRASGDFGMIYGDIYPDHHGKVFLTDTNVVEVDGYWSFSCRRRPPTPFIRALATVVQIVGMIHGPASVVLGIKLQRFFTTDMNATVFEDGKLKGGGK